MVYPRFLKAFILFALIGWLGCSYADETCPPKTTNLPAGWTIYNGRISAVDAFQKAMIINGIYGSVSCYYTNPAGGVMLQKSGNFKPPWPANYWGNCPSGFGQCCVNSLETCTFNQISSNNNK